MTPSQSTDDLVKRLFEAQVGGCECLTKTPEIQYHDRLCKFRLCVESLGTIERLQGEFAARDKTIETLQRALSFWHPGVGGRDDDEFLTRAGDDAMLLFGYMGPHEKSACELGWIAVQDAARSEGGKP